MGKALVGGRSDVHSVRLLDEIRSLRARVAELEAALVRAEEALAAGPVDPQHVEQQPLVAGSGACDADRPAASVAAGESTAP